MIFVKIWQFINLLIYDYKHPQPKYPYGVNIYVGLPGTGKTLSMVEYLTRAKIEFPGVKIYTNFNFKGQDGFISSWRDLNKIENDKGVIFAIDEIQLTFNSRNWSEFPPEMTFLITQNRKLKKQLVCTAQSFSHVDKSFRDLTNNVVECRNIANRWFFNRAFETTDYTKNFDTDRKFRSRAWRYNFIATNELYESYDTLRILQKLVGTIPSKMSAAKDEV